MGWPYRDISLQWLSSVVLVFRILCFFDAFMFQPSGMDTQPGADGLQTFKNDSSLPISQVKKLIGQCIVKTKQWACVTHSILYMLFNDYKEVGGNSMFLFVLPKPHCCQVLFPQYIIHTAVSCLASGNEDNNLSKIVFKVLLMWLKGRILCTMQFPT